MRAKTIFAAAALAVTLVAAALAGAGTTRVYDASGRYRGRIEMREDGQQRAFDAAGRYVGRTTAPGQNGQDRRIYDERGEYRGRSQDGSQGKGQTGQGVKP